MATFICKMCGGNLDVFERQTVVECEYCGSKQTVPTVQDENLQALYNRANVLRIKNEFDRAREIYEKILISDNTQAEAYWGVILCKYGIEYVEDPKTFKRIPTCHRTSFDAVVSDEDYKLAIEYADPLRRKLYEDEAKEIDRIQKSIIEISSKEEPYDVFICYKQTDDTGKRTEDSVIANDIYYQLTNAGFKVFYAAITLEDKIGKEYEPCIFSALNSSKVMLVIGTKPEYFNAVWVKNEWSRYLALIKKDRSKMLIPCYKGMDAYELPDEFAHFQAQDMGKIGFINDIVRGIKKVIGNNTESDKDTTVTKAESSTASLVKRVFMFLEDGDFKSADEYCEKVLDIDPENAEAYLGKLMAELKVRKRQQLADCEADFDKNLLFEKSVRFGDAELKAELEGYKKAAQQQAIYIHACNAMESAKSDKSCISAAQLFDQIIEYKDSEELSCRCRKKAEEIKGQLPLRMKYAFVAARKTIACSKCYGVYVTIDGHVKIFYDSEYKEEYKEFVSENSISDFKDIVAVCIRSISLRSTYIYGLRADGTVVTNDNRIRRKESEWKNIVAIAAGDRLVAGIKADGTVVADGLITDEERDVSGWKDIVAIAVGDSHTIGLKADGTVVATGDNYFGQCDVSGWKDIVAIAAGPRRTVGLRTDGTVVATGDNYFEHDVSGWKDIVAIAAGDSHTIGLKADGTVVATGDNMWGQCDVFDMKDIVSVAAAEYGTFMLDSKGTGTFVGRFGIYGEMHFHKKILLSASTAIKVPVVVQGTTWEELKNLEDLNRTKYEQSKSKYRAQGVCQHCGGSFKGLFSKKCSVCGKPKDY